MTVVVLGLNHQSAPVELRERFAFAEAAIPGALAALRQSGVANEGVILSTCNRVEIYAATALDAGGAFARLKQFLVESRGCTSLTDDSVYTHGEPDSLQHLFRVACGLNSMVLGETEILGQLKKAYDLALQHGHTGSRLNKAFQRAFNVAKQVRTETNIQRGSVSVANVAVELAEKIFSSLKDRQVMVIGAGDTSEKAAKALLSRGAAGLVVTNRSPERAQALADELGGRTLPFEDFTAHIAHVDIVVSSTSAPGYVLDRPRIEPMLRHRRGRPLLLVDIAVPRDIDPDLGNLDNVFVYNVDDLQAIAADYYEQRKQEIAVCETIIREKVAGLLAGFART
jgi:glutamyl-tRNA reductase